MDWGSISTAGHVHKCRANVLFHAASVHPAVMVTWNNICICGCHYENAPPKYLSNNVHAFQCLHILVHQFS